MRLTAEDKAMIDKGYRYRICIPKEGPYNGPSYAKTLMDVGPVLRSYPDLKNIRVIQIAKE